MTEAGVLAAARRRYPDLRMSFEEFLALDDDFHGDWVDGQVYVSGSETERHSDVFGFLAALLQIWVEEHRLGRTLIRFLVRPREDLPGREVDILFLATENPGRIRYNYVDGPPDLVLEIVSDTTRELDRGAKRDEFERGGIREYWLVDPEQERLEGFRLNGAGCYEPIALGDPPMLRSEVMGGMWFWAEWLWQRPMPFLHSVMKEWGLI